MKDRDQIIWVEGAPFIGFGRRAIFLDIARLQAPNPLLYRCYPLTCARSQE
jgi:hypothetical protein